MKFILAIALICVTGWMTVRAELDQIQVLVRQMENVTREMELLTTEVETLRNENQELRSALETLETRMTGQEDHLSNMFDQQAIQDGRILYVEQSTGELQLIDTVLGERITDLEETETTTIAFRTEMTESDDYRTFSRFVRDETGDDNIAKGSTVKFSKVKLNVGNGYNRTTGVFTVPPGGGGYYYFATHFTVRQSTQAYIDLRVNGVTVCTMVDINDEIHNTGSSNGGCSSVVFLTEGDIVQNVCKWAKDPRPVLEGSTGVYNGFIGFRI